MTSYNSTMARRHVPFLLVACILPPFTGLAAPAQQPGEETQIRVTTSLVLVPIAVRDKQGWPVEHLTAADFQLFDNGVRQNLVQCVLDANPRYTVIVFDQSESMQPELPALYAAVREFVTASPGDSISVISVRGSANLDIAPTADPDQLLRGLGVVVAGGRTALFDGVHLGLNRVREARTPHSAVIVLTDGGDNSSRAQPADLETLAAGAGAKIQIKAKRRGLQLTWRKSYASD